MGSIDEVCGVWAVTRHKDLASLLIKKSWVASTPVDVKVLSALKAGQLEVVTKGGAEIVEPLLKAFSDADSEIASRASQCAIALKKSEAQESLCLLVIEQDHQIARQVVITAQYAPRDPNQRALFYFLSEQWDKYESLDYEYTILQTLYELGDEQLRKRIAHKAKQAGRIEWAQIVGGGRKGKRLGEMTNTEWEMTLAVLSEGKHWEEMWQLAQAAPPIWSVRLLRQLKYERWVPKTEFAKLVQMGQKCVADVPDKLNSLWRCQAELCGHKDGVNCLEFSPDGKLLASSAVKDKTVRLWSLPDGKLLQTLTGHSSWVMCLAISPDGKLLASSGYTFDNSNYSGISDYSFDCTIRLWSLPDGNPLQTLTGHSDSVNCLAISPDGKLLASGSWDKTVRLWSLPDGTPLQTLTGHSWGVDLVISPDSKLLASTDGNRITNLWSLPDGKLLQTLIGHIDEVIDLAGSPKLPGVLEDLAISPDSKLLAGGCWDSTVRLWSLPDGKLLQTLIGHIGQVSDLAISPDGKLLASGSNDGILRLWSLPDGNPLQTLTGSSRWINCLGFSPDGKLLASGSSGTVRLWTSGLYYLSRLPVEQISVEDMQWVQEALQDKAISEVERDWLEFIQALIRWQQRFDVEVEDAYRRIDAGEFDIEIEG